MKTEHNSELIEFQSMVLVNAFIFRHTVHDCLDSGGERDCPAAEKHVRGGAEEPALSLPLSFFICPYMYFVS